jgi:DNA-binding NtrC family response regulator
MSSFGARILVVDDEPDIRESLAAMLEKKGFASDPAGSGEEAIGRFESDPYDVVITDIRMPGMNGLDLMRRVKERMPDTVVLLMTAHASLDTAIEAVREGASDYLTKPIRLDNVIHKIRTLLRMRDLEWENRILRLEREPVSYFDQIIGESRSIREVKGAIRRVGPTLGNVLIAGESGTGKELVARAIHAASSGRRGAFVVVNCGSIPDTLLESEFFGHVKGAFTGADRDKDGLYQEARNGTLFLDEIGELPLSLQPKILRAIETKEIRPVGSAKTIPIDVRIVAATNRDLESMVRESAFREDLYFRLNVFTIRIAPLRERVVDIAPLTRSFLEKARVELRSPVREISADAITALEAYSWKGNVRELQNVIQRALITATRPIADATLIEHLLGVETSRDRNLKRASREFERHHIRRVIEEAEGDKRLAAERLGISLASLYAKLKD